MEFCGFLWIFAGTTRNVRHKFIAGSCLARMGEGRKEFLTTPSCSSSLRLLLLATSSASPGAASRHPSFLSIRFALVVLAGCYSHENCSKANRGSRFQRLLGLFWTMRPPKFAGLTSKSSPTLIEFTFYSRTCIGTYHEGRLARDRCPV